jgi:formylglycine-generating enzyme required for sulfatase activity
VIKKSKLFYFIPILLINFTSCKNIEINVKKEKFILNPNCTENDCLELEFINLPDGIYNMGASPYDKKKLKEIDPEPKQKKISSFYIASTETTQKVWTYIFKNGKNKEKYPSFFNENRINQNTDSFPVENINIYDIKKFLKILNNLNLLNKLDSKLDKNSKFEFDLPTEEEWEYAYRLTKKGVNYNTYYWGNNFDPNYCVFGGNTKYVTNIATKKPTELGIYDMSGNVEEWTKTNINNTQYYITRGGNWFLPRNFQKGSSRNNPKATSRSNMIGFRLVIRKTTLEKK